MTMVSLLHVFVRPSTIGTCVHMKLSNGMYIANMFCNSSFSKKAFGTDLNDCVAWLPNRAYTVDVLLRLDRVDAISAIIFYMRMTTMRSLILCVFNWMHA
jgi:hypothetical protein